MEDVVLESLSAPVDEAPRLREQVYRRLRDSILSGEAPAGTRISPSRLAEALGISTMPIREALRLLEDEGLVQSAPRRWTRVASPSPELADELYPLIAALEEFAVSTAREATASALNEMARANHELARAARARDTLACLAADARFHQAIVELADNGSLHRILAELRARIRLLESAFFRTEAVDDSLRDHDQILAALKAGSRAEVARLLHINWMRGQDAVRSF